MPRIPLVSSTDPQYQGQSIGAAQLPGEAIAKAGVAVTDIGREMMAKQVELAQTSDYRG